MPWSDALFGRMAPSTPGTTPLADDVLTAGLERQANFNLAQDMMGLNPQEQNLYQHHLNNMGAYAQVFNPDLTGSTVLQITTQGPNGRFYSLPTVWDGRELPPLAGRDTAVARQGWDYWPSYATEAEAQARYDAMHQFLGRDRTLYGGPY